MTSPTWTGRLGRMLWDELLELDRAHAIECERTATYLDDGVGASAVAAIAVLPPGPRRELEVALWAKRIATGLQVIAVVIDHAFGEAEMLALAQLHRRVRLELRGAS